MNNTTERAAIPLIEAALAMGIDSDALRMRVRRGKVEGFKDNSGHLWVYADAISQKPKPRLPNAAQPPTPEPTELVMELRRQLERLERREADLLSDLRAERDRAASERERSDILLRHSQEQAARMLPPPGEQPQAAPAGQPMRLELAGPTLSTTQAATMLGRSAATLRQWARRADAPLRPLPIPGPLRWSTAEVSRLVRADQH